MSNIGTTHNSPRNGHGKRQTRTRFAIPMTGRVKGSPERGKYAPWFLKSALSKPEYKRRRPMAEAA